MFCPKCSQTQATDDVRFCSRCGLPLEVVAAVVANGGMLPPLPQPAGIDGVPPPSPRLRGVRMGGKMILLGILVLPLLVLVTEALRMPEEPSIAAAVIFFLGGIVRILYALLFEDGPLRRPKPQPALAGPVYTPPPQFADRSWARPDAALPPARESIPTDFYAPPRVTTTEALKPPPSVAEGTTRLLDKEQAES